MNFYERAFLVTVAALSLLQGIVLHRYAREQSLIAVNLGYTMKVMDQQARVIQAQRNALEALAKENERLRAFAPRYQTSLQ